MARDDNRDFDFRAHVEPQPDGGWRVKVEAYWPSHGGLMMGPDTVWRHFGVDTVLHAFTRKGAERKARKAITRLRKAKANEERGSFEVTEGEATP